MTQRNAKSWRLNRQLSISVLIQLVLLASLIVGSWLNLQRQLDLLQRDVTMLLQSEDKFQQKLESLWTQTISQEYRLQAVEQRTAKTEEAF
ncbi:MAG: hypothetical protein ABIF19_06050 [Planctomycetota bacterium]